MSRPATGRAAVLHAYGQPFVVEQVPLPEPEPGALLVQVEVATVCGSDVHIWRGDLEGVLPIELPLILGHEIVGRIVQIGVGAERDSVGRELAVGDRVVWTHEPCGRCHACSVLNEPQLCPTRRVGMLESCARFPFVTGGFAEFSYVWPAAGRLRVPDGIASEHASAASCALRTVARAFDRVGRIGYEDTVVIQGSGPLGLYATAMAACQSPGRLIVIGGPRDRLELAQEWGADVTIGIDEHPDPVERRQLVSEASGPGGPSVLFELSGGPAAVAEGVEMAGPRARYAVVGSVSGPAQPVVAHHVTNRELTVMGVFGSAIDGYYKALQFMEKERDRFDWDKMIGASHGLDGVDDALDAMARGADIKPVIVPGLT